VISRLLRAIGIGRRGEAKQASRTSEQPAQMASAGEFFSSSEASSPGPDGTRERNAETASPEPRSSGREPRSAGQDLSSSDPMITPSRAEGETTVSDGERTAAVNEIVGADGEGTPAAGKVTGAEEATRVPPAASRGRGGRRDHESNVEHRRGQDEDASVPPEIKADNGSGGVEPLSAKVPADEATEAATNADARRGDAKQGRSADGHTAGPSSVLKPLGQPVKSLGGGDLSEANGGGDFSESDEPRRPSYTDEEDYASEGDRQPGSHLPLKGPSTIAPSDSTEMEASAIGGARQSGGGSSLRSARIDEGLENSDDESSSVSSTRDQDSTEQQRATLVTSTDEPTTASAEATGASPSRSDGAAENEQPGTSSVGSVERGTATGPTSKTSSEASMTDVVTSNDKLPNSSSGAARTTGGRAQQGKQSARGSRKRGANRSPATQATADNTMASSARPPGEPDQAAAAPVSGRPVPGERAVGESATGSSDASDPTTSDAPSPGAMVGEASSVSRRSRARPPGTPFEGATAGDAVGLSEQAEDPGETDPRNRPADPVGERGRSEEAPPGLEPGVRAIAMALRAPASRPRESPSATGKTGVDAGTVSAAADDALRTNTAHRTTETSAAGPQDENISPARTTSELGQASVAPRTTGPRRQSIVSRETVGIGEAPDRVGEDEVMEDEAAIAVREAALRAAAQVSGTSEAGQRDGAAMDSKGHVSRETLPSKANVYEGEVQSGMAAGPTRAGAETSHGVDNEQAARDARVTFRIARGGYSRFAVAVANQKGGVGKSTTAVNLGAYLALAGARVLVVDLDPQGNASTGLGLNHRRIEPSVYDVLTGEADAASAIRQTAVGNLDVLPSTIDLAGAEVELVNALSRETRLRQALGAVRYGYDLVFIDCPPSLGLLTVNALAAADELLIPIQCEYYALEGLGQLLRNVDLVRVNLNPGLHIGGIVLTMYDGRTRLAEQVVQEVRKHFSDLVYQTVVPRSVRLSEAPGYGVPIALYDPLSRGGIAYRDLAFELADRTGLLAPTQEGAS
jgi:chromosome partitioning protein